MVQSSLSDLTRVESGLDDPDNLGHLVTFVIGQAVSSMK